MPSVIDDSKVGFTTKKMDVLYQKFKFGNIKKIDREQVFPANKIATAFPWSNHSDASQQPVIMTMAQKLALQNAESKKVATKPTKPLQQPKPVQPLPTVVKPKTKEPAPAKEKELLWSAVIKQSQKVYVNPRGLINNGNMCFMNSILQPLVHCQMFYNLINSIDRHKDMVVLNALKDFLQEFSTTDDEDQEDEPPFQPEYVYDAIKKRSKLDSLKGRQEDAQEFLGFLLDGLHEELLTLNLEEEEWHHIGKHNRPLLNIQKASRLTSIFGGKLKSIVKTGAKESITLEPFQILSVDVTGSNVHSIDSSLLQITTPEIIDDFANKHNLQTTKQTLFEQVPPVLIISMKRFVYDVGQNRTQKVLKHIDISDKLVLPDTVMTSKKSVKYKLYAIINHHGKVAQGGHYTCDVYCNDRQWFRFDDTSITAIDVDVVLQEEKDRQPYILFYILDKM